MPNKDIEILRKKGFFSGSNQPTMLTGKESKDLSATIRATGVGKELQGQGKDLSKTDVPAFIRRNVLGKGNASETELAKSGKAYEMPAPGYLQVPKKIDDSFSVALGNVLTERLSVPQMRDTVFGTGNKRGFQGNTADGNSEEHDVPPSSYATVMHMGKDKGTAKPIRRFDPNKTQPISTGDQVNRSKNTHESIVTEAQRLCLSITRNFARQTADIQESFTKDKFFKLREVIITEDLPAVEKSEELNEDMYEDTISSAIPSFEQPMLGVVKPAGAELDSVQNVGFAPTEAQRKKRKKKAIALAMGL